MSVKMKLITLLVVSLIGFALIFAADFMGRRSAARMDELGREAARARITVLQCRRQESDFLLRLDEKHATLFGEALAEADQALEALAKAGDIEGTDKARKLLRTYEESFNSLAAITRTIGLTEKDGLRWTFISAARDLEAKFKGQGGQETLIALLQLRRQEKNYMLRRTDTYLTRARDRMAALNEQVQAMDVPDEARAGMSQALDAYAKAFESYVAMVTDSESAKETLVRTAEALEPEIDAIREQCGQRQQAIHTLTARIKMGIEAGTVLGIALLSLWVIASVTRPLAALAAYTTQVADGNLNARPEGRFQAEFGLLAQDVARMVEELKRRLAEVEQKQAEATEQAENARAAMLEAKRQQEHALELKDRMRDSAVRAEAFSTRVARNTEELSAMISQVKHGATLQTERMEQTATAMEQMNTAVLEVARNAGEASENARDTKAKAENGARLVKNAVTAIATVNEHTANMRRGIEDLERQVESIGQVMDVISEIADQTNLLALNAAIEAARAGDAGRGFAVVADEVRKLAEKTMAATQEVGQSISAIREATGRNIQTTRDAVRAVEESTRLAMETGAAQEEILRLVDANSLQVEGIASASEQQSATSDQINGAVSEVRTVAEESLQGMHRSYEAVQSLTALSGELMQMIQEMLGEDDATPAT